MVTKRPPFRTVTSAGGRLSQTTNNFVICVVDIRIQLGIKLCTSVDILWILWIFLIYVRLAIVDNLAVIPVCSTSTKLPDSTYPPSNFLVRNLDLPVSVDNSALWTTPNANIHRLSTKFATSPVDKLFQPERQKSLSFQVCQQCLAASQNIRIADVKSV